MERSRIKRNDQDLNLPIYSLRSKNPNMHLAQNKSTSVLDQNERRIKRRSMKKKGIIYELEESFLFCRSSSMKPPPAQSPIFYPPPPLPFASQQRSTTPKSPHVKFIRKSFQTVDSLSILLARTDLHSFSTHATTILSTTSFWLSQWI